MLIKQTKFILAIALQVVIVFTIIIFKSSILIGGTDVLLKIEPVDPRDLLRGDYVIFQYSISNFDSDYASGQQIKNGDAVYVVLRQTGKYWTAQGVQKNQPTGNKLFIKGKVESGGLESQTDPFLYQRFGGSQIHVVYGIEEYFIPEGEGRNFNFWNKEAAARVAVDKNGNAALKQIYVDDKPWPSTTFDISENTTESTEKKTRDAKRISDIKQIQTGLELYYNDHGFYPEKIEFGKIFKSLDGKTVYMGFLPTNPMPGGSPYKYARLSKSKNDYIIDFSLEIGVGDLKAGHFIATPSGIGQERVQPILNNPVCPTLYNPVCGIDNKIYFNDCVAKNAGVEIKYKGRCVVTGTEQDIDKDGLSDEQEKIIGTNPNNPDSDGDGFLDGEEVKAGYDPLNKIKGAK